MSWGQVTIGGIVFREELKISESGDGGLNISGQESTPPSPKDEVRAAHENLLGLRGRIVPVVFTDKEQVSGFFYVESVTSELMELYGRTVTVSWRMELSRVGFGPDVEFESRFPFIARTDDLTGSQVASFWHAPAPSASGYYTGSTVPSGSLDRVSSDGTVKVYTGLPTTTPPRWFASAEGYLVGSARVELDGRRHAGTLTPPHDTWALSNGIIRVRPTSTGGIGVSVWRGIDGWSTEKVFSPTVSGVWLSVTPGVAPEFTILRNDPEEAKVRLTYPSSPGRVTVDLVLRRGARFVTGVLKRHAAANLGITRTVAEAGTSFTGGIVATAGDAEDVRYLLGSSKAPSSSTTPTASMTRNTVTQLDFFLGAVFAGAPAGDTHTDLLLQYLGTTGDETRVMLR
jgi:hypothetical protein